MSYLSVSELDTQLYPEIRKAISREPTADDGVVVAAAINRALSMIQAKLSRFYDIAQEFQKSQPLNSSNADARSQVLIGIAKDLAIFYLYQNPESMPLHRFKAYEASLALLNELMKGSATLVGVDPAPAPETPQVEQFGKWGSNPKRDAYY